MHFIYNIYKWNDTNKNLHDDFDTFKLLNSISIIIMFNDNIFF